MRRIAILFTSCILASCINNDIPYDYINGEVLAFEAQGAQEVAIDNEKHIVSLVLSETQDPRAVKVTKFEITPDAKSTLSVGTELNTTSTNLFTITTNQVHEWKINTTQPIERYFTVKNQIGSPVINIEEQNITVKVPASQSLNSITVLDCKLGPLVAGYSADPMSFTNFTKPHEIDVMFWGITQTWTLTVIQQDATVTTQPADAWGRFAHLSGGIITGSSQTASFEYRTKQSQNWINVPADVEGAVISAKLSGLTAETQYVYRARLGEDVGNEVEFTTEATPSVPNMSMDEWLLKGKNWYANTEGAAEFWASGNEGATLFANANTTPTEDAHNGKAAHLESIKVALVGMAAGNLFTGSFKTNISNPSDSPGFSQAYTGRPTELSFWYKYSPKPLNSSKTPAEIKGQMDKFTFYIILGNWNGQLKSSQVKGANTVGAIAYGEFISDAEVTTYTKKTIKIEYSNLVERPTRMMIVASSSARGEEYIGGIGSTLWIDELEFGWE